MRESRTFREIIEDVIGQLPKSPRSAEFVLIQALNQVTGQPSTTVWVDVEHQQPASAHAACLETNGHTVEQVDVMFRFDQHAKVVYALFPGLAGTHELHTCSCYEHVGQHSTADLRGCVNGSRPATPQEYESLKRELESAPYHYFLRVVQRATRHHETQRSAAIRGVDAA